MSSTRTVFVARHGTTPLNADGRLRGHLDVELDGAGRLEAARLANTFARVPLTRIVSSPLLRARQTAAPIAAVLDIAVEPDVGFIDRDYGAWAGRSVAEVEQRFGEIDAAPGVEPWATFERRIVDSFLRVLSERPSDDPILIVGHDATNQALLRAAVPGRGALGVTQHTGCWNRLDLVDGVWHATVVNRTPTDHTPPIVP